MDFLILKAEIKNLVTDLTKTFGTRNIFRLLDLMNIEIIRKPLPSKKAMSQKNLFGDMVIYLSNSVHENEEKFILAHELAHLILHKKVNCTLYFETFINKDRIEFEANYFALELLFYDVDIYEIENFSLEQLSIMYGIPQRILYYKLNEIATTSCEINMNQLVNF